VKNLYPQLLRLCVAFFSAQSKDGVNIAVVAGSSRTLETYLGAVGLIDTCQGKGRFTVYTTTGKAFAHIPNADRGALLKDKTQLTAGLTYHVKVDKVTTAKGSELTTTTMGGVNVGNASVVKMGMTAYNGVIQAIDTAITPKRSVQTRNESLSNSPLSPAQHA
jgi:uncharacterized surface protein with fasciclin (FAS1) repeats